MASAEEFLGLTKKPSAAEFLGTAKAVIDTAEPPDRAVEGREAARGTDADALSAEASPFGGSSGTLQRVWDGFLGKDVSRMGRYGMGLGDPFFGGAQIGARMMASPGGGVPEQAGAPAGPDRTAEVDAATQQREESYQQREKAAGLSLPENAGTLQRLWHGLTTEGPRLAGNVTATAPLAAVPAAGTTVPARIGLGAAAGALGGASMPVTGQPGQQTPNFLREKLKQAGYGALGGAAGQAVGEAIPPVARAIGQSLRPAPGSPLRPPEVPRPPGPMMPQTQQMVQQRFQQAVPMSPAGVRGAPDIATQQANRATAVQSILTEQPNLVFDRARGTVSGQLPETRQELSEAVDQTKNSLFQKWDKMTQDTETGINPESSTINKHKEEWADAQRGIAEANQNLREANTAHTLAKAQQSSAGSNVYRAGAANAAERSARVDVQKATRQLEIATRRAERARADLRKPWVDLKPTVRELDRFADSDSLKLTPGSEGVISYAKRQAEKYAETEAASPQAVQSAITKANASLASFYKNPSYESAARAGVDAMVANQLRRGLDDVISKVTGPGYQQLKLQYGSLSAIEKETSKAAVRAMGDRPETRLIEALTNVTSTEELLRGLITMRVDPIMRGLLVRAGRMFDRYVNNPDRAVKMMFQQAERAQRIGQAGFARNALAGALAVGGGEQMQERPRVGGRGPLGGRIIATTPTRRDVYPSP